MPNDHTTAHATVPIRDGNAVLSGYNIRVRVERRHLAVEDGCGLDRREARFSKAPSRLRRLVILGHTGFISLEALRWLADAKAALVVIDADGKLIAVTAPQRINDSRLRRLQALAVGTSTGVAITRGLLRQKLIGQRDVLTSIGALDSTRAGVFDELITRIELALTIDQCLAAEAGAAAHYFKCWEGRVSAQFVKRDTGLIPDHWKAFEGRSSLLTAAPYRATDPVNAILNYLNAIALAEVRIGLLTFGLDPGLGFAHVDANRDSLACDVIEAARPQVEAWLLDFLAKRPLRASEFCEERDGRCRLTAPLAHELAPSIGRWRSVIAPIVEHLVDQLNADDRILATSVGITPRATRPRLRNAEKHVSRARIGTTVDRRRKYESGSIPDRRCPNCGKLLRGKRCSDCGFTPITTDTVGTDRQRATMMKRQRTNRGWRGPVDDRDFRRDILPGLQGVTLRRIMEATGLSKRFASQIRSGLAVPHRRHWPSLMQLISAPTGSTESG
jgi:CRISPR-associated endonuclease Cas1